MTCVHVSPRGDCQIYEERPNSCRTFSCAWLLCEELGEELRPDRCGAVLAFFARTPKLLTMHVDPEHNFCWTHGPVKTVVSQALLAGNSVQIVCGERRYVMLPPKPEAQNAELQNGRAGAG